MEITLEYNTGQTFQITIPVEALQNNIACILDDVSTKVEARIVWTA